MVIGRIKEGDLVFIEKKQGWRFYAEVTKNAGKELEIKPMQTHGPMTTFRTARAHEVKKHWRLLGAKAEK